MPFKGERLPKHDTMPHWTATIDGMHCGGCEDRVETRLSRIDGVRSVQADHEAGEASIRFIAGQEDAEALETAVDELGFALVGLDGD